jgi:spore coat protein W
MDTFHSERGENMGKNKDKLTGISSDLMEIFVADVLKKNNVSKDTTSNLSDEQKQKLKKVVEDLQSQVDEFLAGKPTQVTEEQVEEELKPLTSKKTTLRDLLRNKSEE